LKRLKIDDFWTLKSPLKQQQQQLKMLKHEEQNWVKTHKEWGNSSQQFQPPKMVEYGLEISVL